MLNKTEKYAAIALICMLALPACRQDEPLNISDSAGKNPIELTVGLAGENPTVTKSVVTTDSPYGQSAQAFAAGTSIYMVMKSEKANADAVYSRTIGYAQEAAVTPANSTIVKFASSYGRFWEDSHSRDSQLSVYAACVPGYYLAGSVYDGVTPDGTADATTWTVGGSATYNNIWDPAYGSTTIAWPLRGASVASQSTAFVASQDLCFSNNVSDLGASDNRVTFNSSLKKFGSGRLVFYHALTKVTFRIKKGEGFELADPFAFTNPGENIVLKGFNTSGIFDVIDGEFKTSDPAIGTGDITCLASQGASGDYVYVLDCLMLPGTDLNNTEADKIYFTIDNNLYHLTKKQLMDALVGKKLSDTTTDALTADHKMRPGVHYIFDMTVGKKKMDNFTASVVDWEEVTSANTVPSNARILVSLLVLDSNRDVMTGDPATFSLYRATNYNSGASIDDNYVSYDWDDGYAITGNKAELKENTASSGIYTAYDDATDPDTAWYWPDNRTFYHFRTVQPLGETVSNDAVNGYDYLSLAGAPYGDYTDVRWGAPFKSTAGKLTYSLTSGFDNTTGANHQIYKAIGPTEDNINLIMLHMMSDVTINLTTPTVGDADYSARVELAGALMELSNIHPTGEVRMGDGLVTATGVPATVNNTVSAVNQVPWHYGFVPQDLTDVVLTITTADHNQYIVPMKDVVSAGYSNYLIANPYTDKIGRWYPNFKYTYTFKLTKAGIASITATLADWETVTAGDDNVQIQ